MGGPGTPALQKQCETPVVERAAGTRNDSANWKLRLPVSKAQFGKTTGSECQRRGGVGDGGARGRSRLKEKRGNIPGRTNCWSRRGARRSSLHTFNDLMRITLRCSVSQAADPSWKLNRVPVATGNLHRYLLTFTDVALVTGAFCILFS